MTKCKHYIDSIYYDMELTSHAMKALGAQLFELWGGDLTPMEHAALDTIFCNTGICQRDLAKLLLKDRANTGRLLDSLEAKGYITRFIDMKDNRLVKKMGVTEKGHEKLEEIRNMIESHFKSISSEFAEDEVEMLQAALRKFREKILTMVNMNI